MVKIFTGVGSRETPHNTLNVMSELSMSLASDGWTLRSGGAPGADTAFENGHDRVGGSKEIYLPSKGFFGNSSPLHKVTDEALTIASQFHPRWVHLSPTAKRLMARNVYQVLGSDLNTPTSFVVCWTRDGCEDGSKTSTRTGGTGQAIRVASFHHIPIFNLYNKGRLNQLLDFIDNEMYNILHF